MTLPLSPSTDSLSKKERKRLKKAAAAAEAGAGDAGGAAAAAAAVGPTGVECELKLKKKKDKKKRSKSEADLAALGGGGERPRAAGRSYVQHARAASGCPAAQQAPYLPSGRPDRPSRSPAACVLAGRLPINPMPAPVLSLQPATRTPLRQAQ